MAISDTRRIILHIFFHGITIMYAIIAIFPLLRRLLKQSPSRPVEYNPPQCLNDGSYGRHMHIKLTNIRLHYVENGDRTKPLMLFLHGYPEFWFSWRHQMRTFSATHWVVAVDLRGFGQSEKPRGKDEYGINVVASDIIELINALEANSCILIGHDWGGVVAWAVSASKPNSLQKLILINSTHLSIWLGQLKASPNQNLKSWYSFVYQIPKFPEWVVSHNGSETLRRIFSDHNSISFLSEEELEAYTYTYLKNGRRTWTAPMNYYRKNLSAAELARTLEPPDTIDVPTLIVWGGNDLFLSTDILKLSVSSFRNVTTKYIPQGTHFVHQRKAPQVNSYIAEFLKTATQTPGVPIFASLAEVPEEEFRFFKF